MRHRNGDELFGLPGECSIGEYALTKGLEGLIRFGRQAMALLGEFPRCCG
jgi:hypothetical protein